MRTLRATAVAVVAPALLALAALPASAADRSSPTGYVKSVVRYYASTDKATLDGMYRCPKGVDGVLWASAKQGGSARLDVEGSAGTAATWYDTHAPLTCDGHAHYVTVPLTREDIPAGAFPEFPEGKHYVPFQPTGRAGRAWIQWCITDANAASQEESLLFSEMEFGGVQIMR